MRQPVHRWPIHRRARLAFAIVLWLLAIGLLGWGLWPKARESQTLTLDLTNVSGSELRAQSRLTDSGATDHADYAITVDYPRLLRAGDSELVHLRIDPLSGLPEDGPMDTEAMSQQPRSRAHDSGAETLAIQARLELHGAAVSPEGDTTSPWSAEKGAAFIWAIRSAGGATARGTAWTFLIPVGSPDLVGERIALSAQPLEIGRTTLLGVTGPAARGTGGALMVLGTLLGMPGLDHVLRKAIQPRHAGPD